MDIDDVNYVKEKVNQSHTKAIKQIKTILF